MLVGILIGLAIVPAAYVLIAVLWLLAFAWAASR